MLDAIVISAAQFPTVVVYLMDTVRSTNPVTFMSNMLYACSILLVGGAFKVKSDFGYVLFRSYILFPFPHDSE